MKSIAIHKIHKQTLDIRFLDFTTLHTWTAVNQAKTVDAVRKSLEQCLEEYDFAKGYLTIERLELDLGVFSADQLLSKMPEKLYQELQKILSSHRIEINNLGEAEIIKDAAGKRKREPIVKNSEVAAFLFFLHHGYLPWWYSNQPAWDPDWIQKLTQENWQELRNFFTAYPENEVYYERALLRLISQFSDGFLASLLNGLQMKEPVEKAWSWLAHFYDTLQERETGSSLNESALHLSVFRQHFWKNWINYAAGRSAVPQLAALFALFKQPSSIPYFLLGIEENNEWIDSIPEFWRNELISLQQEKNRGKSGSSASSEFVNNIESEKFKEPGKAEYITEADSILIPGAGLVLLHPFLQRLFGYCNLLDENEFINDEARNRAVYLLHYLAAGDEEAPEYVLMLPKLLCGIPLEWPLEPALPLTDTEKAACDDMLVQVIAHWKALRSTSPAGLREAFLWRQGKLFSTDEGWRLEVQRKTEDILLNRLPWSFSMIKFSWMPRLLSVSWE